MNGPIKITKVKTITNKKWGQCQRLFVYLRRNGILSSSKKSRNEKRKKNYIIHLGRVYAVKHAFSFQCMSFVYLRLISIISPHVWFLSHTNTVSNVDVFQGYRSLILIQKCLKSNTKVLSRTSHKQWRGGRNPTKLPAELDTLSMSYLTPAGIGLLQP